MGSKTVFTVQTVVAMVLYMGSMSLAQSADKDDPAAAARKKLFEKSITGDGGLAALEALTCSSKEEKLVDALGLIGAACSAAHLDNDISADSNDSKDSKDKPATRRGNAQSTRSKKCSESLKKHHEYCATVIGEYDNAIGMSDDSTENETESKTGKEICDAAKTVKSEGCAYMLPQKSETNSDKKDLRAQEKEFKDQYNKAKKEADEKRQKAQDDINKMDDDSQKADQDYKKDRMDLLNKMQEKIADADRQKAAANADTMKKMDEIDVEYIKTRDKLRRAASTQSVLKSTWTLQCRSYAYGESKKTEAEWEARLKQEDQVVKNWSISRSSGKLNRDLKKKREKILFRYNEALARCNSGEIGPGHEMNAKLISAQQEEIDSTALANDQAARLEKLRQQWIGNLQSSIQGLDQQKQQAVTMMQNQLTQMDQNFQTNSWRNTQRKQQLYQNLQQQARNSEKELQGIQDKIDSAMKESTRASALASCGAIPSAQEKESSATDIKNGVKALDTARALCKSANSCSNLKPDKFPACEIFVGKVKDEDKKPDPPAPTGELRLPEIRYEPRIPEELRTKGERGLAE